MYIDLSAIPKDKPAAVVIPDRECAEAFLKEMKTSHPEKVQAWRVADYSYDICYIPHFECGRGMTIWNVTEAKRAGYEIVEWEQISGLSTLETGISEYGISMLLE